MAQVPVVVSEQYVAQEHKQLSIARKVAQISGGDFAITDSSGTPLFKLKGSMVSLRDKRVMYDKTETPVLTLHKKLISMHDTWEAYRGGESNDLLFSMKKEHMMNRGGVEAYEIFVANVDGAEYTVKGDFLHRNYSIVYHDEMVVAEVSKKLFNLASWFGGKNKYGVKVNAGADEALVAAVVIMVDSIHQEDKDSKGEGSSSDDSD